MSELSFAEQGHNLALQASMPTATTTITRTTLLLLNLGLSLSNMAQTSKAAALHSLYSCATRAFVLRDIALTYSLLQSAFSLLNPPTITWFAIWPPPEMVWIYSLYFSTVIHRVSAKSFRTSLMESPQTLATSIYPRYLAFILSTESLSKTALSAAYLSYQAP